MSYRDFQKAIRLCGDDGLKEKSCHSKKDLEEAGFSQENISGLHSPIGLAIGGQTPEEIALSVISEIVKCKNERTGCTQVDKEVLDALIEAAKQETDTQASDEKYILCTIIKEWQCTARSRNTDARELRQSDYRNYRRRLCGGRGYKLLQETVSQAGVQMRFDGCEHEH